MSMLKFFEPGFDGDVVVRSAAVKDTQSMGPMLVVELEVEACDSHEIAHHPVGWTGAWIQRVEDPSIFAWTVGYLVAACRGYGNDEPEKIMPLVGAWEQTLREAELLAGSRVHLQTLRVTTRHDRDFTRYVFSPALQ